MEDVTIDAILALSRSDHNAYYRVLHVSPTATRQEVRKQFRKLALKFHPDKNSAPRASEAFVAIGTAFEVLSDDAARQVYDREQAQRGGRSSSGGVRAGAGGRSSSGGGRSSSGFGAGGGRSSSGVGAGGGRSSSGVGAGGGRGSSGGGRRSSGGGRRSGGNGEWANAFRAKFPGRRRGPGSGGGAGSSGLFGSSRNKEDSGAAKPRRSTAKHTHASTAAPPPRRRRTTGAAASAASGLHGGGSSSNGHEFGGGGSRRRFGVRDPSPIRSPAAVRDPHESVDAMLERMKAQFAAEMDAARRAEEHESRGRWREQEAVALERVVSEQVERQLAAEARRKAGRPKWNSFGKGKPLHKTGRRVVAATGAPSRSVLDEGFGMPRAAAANGSESTGIVSVHRGAGATEAQVTLLRRGDRFVVRSRKPGVKPQPHFVWLSSDRLRLQWRIIRPSSPSGEPDGAVLVEDIVQVRKTRTKGGIHKVVVSTAVRTLNLDAAEEETAAAWSRALRALM